MSRRLSYRQDGTFTIVQFTDLHWKTGTDADRSTRKLMELVLDTENPDLVVFTGDVIYTGHNTDCEDPVQAFNDAVAAVEERSIPWAVIFGNHDTESLITRKELMQLILSHQHTVTEAGPEEIRITSYNVCYTKLLRIFSDSIDQRYAPSRNEGFVHLELVK